MNNFKIMIVGRRRPGQSLATHRQHMKEVHGAMVLAYIAQHPQWAPRRYVQNHAFDGTFRWATPGTDPFALAQDFVTEVSFPDPAAAVASREQPYYLQHLRGDEQHFVDERSVVPLPVREREMLSREGASAAGVKLFVFVSKTAATSPDAFRKIWESQGVGLCGTTTLSGVLRHQQNDVQSRLGDTPLVDGVEVFWLSNAEAAHELASNLKHGYLESLISCGAVRADSLFVVLAHEHVMHAGGH